MNGTMILAWISPCICQDSSGLNLPFKGVDIPINTSNVI